MIYFYSDLLSDHTFQCSGLILMGTTVWMLFFAIVSKFYGGKKDDKMMNRTKTRIVSIAHAHLILFYAIYDLFSNNIDLKAKTTDIQSKVLLTSSGYFIYDVLICM